MAHHVVLNAKDVNGVPFIKEQVMIAGNALQGQANWLIRLPGENPNDPNYGWFDYISADGNPTNGLTHACNSPVGGTGTVYRGPQP